MNDSESSGFKFSQLEMSESPPLYAPPSPPHPLTIFTTHIEVVLTLLLHSFKFTLSDKQIVWRMRGITVPSVSGDPDLSKTQLPMVVQMAD
jgi:hypothetical protein